MSGPEKLDELDRKEVDSSDDTDDRPQNQEEEEEIIDLNDIIELPNNGTLGDILSDLEEQGLEKEAVSDTADINFELGAGRDADMKEDLLSELFESEEATSEEDTVRIPVNQGQGTPAQAIPFSIQPDEKDFPFFDNEESRKAEPEEKARDSTSLPPAAKKDPLIEEVIDQLEERLLETVQRIVEAKLPDIVRTALREEIERLKLEHSGSSLKK